MSFMTVLDKVGEDIANIFKKAEPVVAELQTIATPFENIYAPGLATLINTGLTEIAQAQSMAVLAGQTSGSGAVKLASVIASLATSLGPVLTSLGVNTSTVTSTQYTNFVNGLVQAANAFIITQATVPSTPTPTTVAPAVTPAAVVVAAPVTGAAVPPK